MQPTGMKVPGYLGNLNLENRNVSCGVNSLYEYNTSVTMNRSISKKEQVYREQESSMICLYHEYNGDLLYCSPVIPGLSDEEPVKFRPTKLHFNAPLLLPTIIDRLFIFYFQFESKKELHTRQMIFADIFRTKYSLVCSQVEDFLLSTPFLDFLGLYFLIVRIMISVIC